VDSAETKNILGIDEVGRGPWAGPLVVGAVILGKDFPDLDLTDSKRLSPKKRAALAPLIQQHAVAAATGWVSAPELDTCGLSASLKLATRRAVKQILDQLKTLSPSESAQFDEIIIDGTVNFLKGTPLEDRVTVLKKADSLIKEVSAASIIAKVARDEYMVKLAAEYPVYGFENHVGYGTAQHKAALLGHGICPEHRQSFRPIRKIMTQNPAKSPETPSASVFRPDSPKPPFNRTISANAPKPPSTSQKGYFAENCIADYLQSLGHTVIAHNFKTKSYEIDLISIKSDQICFTEVKYRQNDHHGSALEQITPQKHQQMRYAAEKFLSTHPQYANFQPLLAVASVIGLDYRLEQWFTLSS